MLLVALFFSRIRLPEIGMNQPAETEVQTGGEAAGSLWSHRNFTWGLVALFLYVAAQTGINSFFINYVTEHAGITAREASLWLSFGG